jgi:hypothetical protein
VACPGFGYAHSTKLGSTLAVLKYRHTRLGGTMLPLLMPLLLPLLVVVSMTPLYQKHSLSGSVASNHQDRHVRAASPTHFTVLEEYMSPTTYPPTRNQTIQHAERFRVVEVYESPTDYGRPLPPATAPVTDVDQFIKVVRRRIGFHVNENFEEYAEGKGSEEPTIEGLGEYLAEAEGNGRDEDFIDEVPGGSSTRGERNTKCV